MEYEDLEEAQARQVARRIVAENAREQAISDAYSNVFMYWASMLVYIAIIILTLMSGLPLYGQIALQSVGTLACIHTFDLMTREYDVIYNTGGKNGNGEIARYLRKLWMQR